MDNTAIWIFGPQLMGVMFLIIGGILYLFPPKRINDFYGYKTEAAKKNQQTWDAANRYSSIYLIKAGLALLIIGFMITALFNEVVIPFKLRAGLTVFLLILSAMLPTILMIVSTEKYLTKTFGDKE
jgi:uncharacterized membrane protein